MVDLVCLLYLNQWRIHFVHDRVPAFLSGWVRFLCMYQYIYICGGRFDTVAETCRGAAWIEATLTSEYAGFGGEKGVETGHR